MRSIRFVLALSCLAAPAIVGCSDPVPLIPRGAWALTFQDPGPDCNVSGHNASVGTVGSEGEIEYQTDGTDDAEISCEVAAAGGAFNFSGRVRYKGQYLAIESGELAASATLDEPSTGTVEFQTVQSTSIYSSSACILYFVGDNGQTVEDGRVWGSFQCPSVSAGQDNVCAVTQGYFAFENCVGGTEEEE